MCGCAALFVSVGLGLIGYWFAAWCSLVVLCSFVFGFMVVLWLLGCGYVVVAFATCLFWCVIARTFCLLFGTFTCFNLRVAFALLFGL